MKKGFTIIELMVVVAILAVLLGIVTTAATASIRKARERRILAMKQTLQNGIAAFRERKDEWPGKLEEWAKNPPDKGTLGYLSNVDYDKVMQELLKMSVGKSPQNRVLDPVGLFVVKKTSPNRSTGGRDFRAVAKKSGKYGKRMSSSEMTVVYPSVDSGDYAYRYVIEYNTKSDAVTVMTQGEYNSKYPKDSKDSKEDPWNGGEKWH